MASLTPQHLVFLGTNCRLHGAREDAEAKVELKRTPALAHRM